MNEIAWLVLLLAVIIVVAAVAWRAGQGRRSARLQERFGPEYDRAVASTGRRSAAEAELEAREERVEALEIRSLDAADRERFRERWRVVQALFVDDPAGAVQDADDLIGEVMRARGYPVGDFEQRAADVSVNHPHVVDHYRTAHAIAVSQKAGSPDTEQLRQAMVHFRALFADLLDLPTADGPTTIATASPATDGPPEDRAPDAPTTDVGAANATTTSTARRLGDEPVASGADTEGTPR